MRTLSAEIDRIVSNAFAEQSTQVFSKATFVDSLKELYESSKKNERGDVLVPFSHLTIEDQPIGSLLGERENSFYIKYRWNKGLYSEFIVSTVKKDRTIQKGTVIDRLGKPDGQYVSPIPSKAKPYNVAERALPYYFLENDVIFEPSYHVYRVIKTISQKALIEAIKTDTRVFRSQDAKAAALEDIIRCQGITHGQVAPVASFLSQGLGGGDQYKLPVPVAVLIQLGFLKWER